MMMIERFLSLAVKALLFLTLLTPFVISRSPYLSPLVFERMLFYRTVIELAAVLGAALLAFLAWRAPARIVSCAREFFSSRLTLFLLAFFAAAAVSTALAPNVFHAFWGDAERGEGYLGLLHYFAFFILAFSLFDRKEWLWYFAGAVAAGVVLSFYAWLQYFGVRGFPFSLPQDMQPGSFTGNPAFLSAYLILLLVVVAILWNELGGWRKKALAAAALLFVATIFVAAIRGAIIGLAAGAALVAAYAIFKSSSRRLRIAGATTIAALVVFAGIFLATRAQPVWLAIPGFDRLAIVSFDAPSVSTRLIGLRVSWEAFKERPFFGWGPENYAIAYNKHYDPAYARYAEDWFDRAHNKIAETGVMYGIVGLALYLGILGAAFQQARRMPLILGALTAYVVQNLFFFDTIVSYALFFAVLGRLAVEDRPAGAAFSGELSAGVSRILRCAAFLGCAADVVLVAYLLYASVYLPIAQASRFRQAVSSKAGERILAASDGFLRPYTFLQPSLRAELNDLLYNNNLFRQPSFRPLIEKTLAALEEAAEREQDPRYFMRLVEMQNELAKQDPSLLKRSEAFARKALALSPNRQGLMNHLAFALAGLGAFEEAIETDRRALALDPSVYKSHYQLGLVLLLAGEPYRTEAIEHLDRSWELAKQNNFLVSRESDFLSMLTISRHLEDHRKTVDVLEAMVVCPALADRICFPNDKRLHLDLLRSYGSLRDSEGLIRTALRMKEKFPELGDDLDVIIDLAQKKNWEIIESL